ncbi:MAG: hypothetical protein QNJ29_11980 [Rhizobiaceae bacterium]|nr:hypothetical protein [Rhizobiaceae bacterium]
MRLTHIITLTATLGLALATAAPSMAQSTRNISPNNVGNGIGGNNIGGGGNNFGCVNVTLAGATSVRVCQNGYTARLGNIICSGYVSTGYNSYRLAQAPCNQAGQNFLGGTLACSGNACNWTPSAAGRAQGFQQEYVSAYFN